MKVHIFESIAELNKFLAGKKGEVEVQFTSSVVEREQDQASGKITYRMVDRFLVIEHGR